MQWLHYLNSVRREGSRHSRNKKKAYLKSKIDERETNSKMKNIRDSYRGINAFKKGYQPRNKIVKDEKSDLFADSHSILARWKTHFSQLLNVQGISNVRKIEPQVPEPSVFEVKMAIE
jgi:hypothetical protein